MQQQFPDDENGDVLRLMVREGDDLSKARDIDFSIIFPNLPSAHKFIERLAGRGLKAAIAPEPIGTEKYIDVTVTKFLLPTHEGISDFERELESVSGPLGGKNDGWGSQAQ